MRNITLMVLLIFTISFSACGSGGDGDNTAKTDAALTGSNAPNVVRSVISGIDFAVIQTLFF